MAEVLSTHDFQIFPERYIGILIDERIIHEITLLSPIATISNHHNTEISFLVQMFVNTGHRTLTDLIEESVHTSDDEDIGDIEAASRDFIVVKRGLVKVHHYYIPVNKVEGWDGNVVWLKSTEEQVKQSYERDVEPDPSTYYLKGNPMHRALSYPKVPTLVSRYRERVRVPIASTSQSAEQPTTCRCALCDMTFRTEDELSNHVATQH